MKYLPALLVALLLAACSPQAPAATPTTVATPTAVPVATASPTVPAERGDPVLYMHRSGGLAGVDEEFWVFADGWVDVKGGSDRKLDPARVTRALAELEEDGFFALADEYGLDGTCNDCFTYEIAARDEEGNLKTVTAVREAPETPKAVQEIIARLDVLLPPCT